MPPHFVAHLVDRQEYEMKKVPMFFALAFMFSPFAIAEPDDKGKLNDGEILQVVVTANQGDIEKGELARKQASNKQVRAFANRMIKERNDINKEAKVLFSKLKKTPEESTISKNLKADGKKTLDQLRNLNGREFDKAYIDAEIKHNQELIDVADNTLIPNVKDEAVKALLIKVRPALAAHIEFAKTIEGSMMDKR